MITQCICCCCENKANDICLMPTVCCKNGAFCLHFLPASVAFAPAFCPVWAHHSVDSGTGTQCCCTDSRCAVPCDDDVPFQIGCMGMYCIDNSNSVAPGPTIVTTQQPQQAMLVQQQPQQVRLEGNFRCFLVIFLSFFG